MKINFLSDNIILKNTNNKNILEEESSHVSKEHLKKSKKAKKIITFV